jgi:hypothetical protein
LGGWMAAAIRCSSGMAMLQRGMDLASEQYMWCSERPT